nr:AKR_HP1_G0046300.mRNA.1.CDS.1 [Saccharomyces cerevisiae]
MLCCICKLKKDENSPPGLKTRLLLQQHGGLCTPGCTDKERKYVADTWGTPQINVPLSQNLSSNGFLKTTSPIAPPWELVGLFSSQGCRFLRIDEVASYLTVDILLWGYWDTWRVRAP